MLEERIYRVGFSHVKGIGSVRLRALIDFFGDARTAWHAPADALREAGLGPKLLGSFLDIRSTLSLEETWEDINNKGILVFIWEDQDYPRRLKEIDNAPPVLYVKGSLQEDDEWSVAVVGTRRVTSYGRQAANEITRTLASSGISVVSGLARGVDAVAHRAALNAGGRTLAVLGSGVDRIYPPEHRKLADQVMANGAVISDYVPGTPPEGVNFPPRNRIISGLSLAVIVVEAGKQSGALITASFAADQGRDVFAIPGNIYAPQSIGANRLIQKGAQPLLDAQDILESLNLSMVTEHRTARTVLPSDATEAKLFDLLGSEPLHVDEVRAQSDLPIDKVTSTLALMELKGLVRQVGSMHYIAVRERTAEYEVGKD